MKQLLHKVIFIVLLNINHIGHAQNAYQYTPPPKLQDGWEVNGLKSTALDTTRLYALFNQLLKADHKIDGLVVIKNNELVLEEYFHEYDVNKPHDLRSVTKSIRSMLLGIAIDQGIIENINDPISKYLKSHSPKKNLDERKDAITIKHLVTMSTGLDCNDWDKKSMGQEDRVYKKKDWIQYTLNLPMIHEPGEVSSYCSMGVVLLAEIISQASGLTIDQFAGKYLFSPLGIQNLQWGHTSNKGVVSSGKRLHMTPRDLAKIGQLILNEGSWNGQQIVSAKWIKDATTPKATITGIDYGYLWWNIPFTSNGRTIVSKIATGNGGQYIMILPDSDLVAVFTGSAYNSSEDKLPFAVMKDVIIPTFNAQAQKTKRP